MAGSMAETDQEQLLGVPIGERLRLAREERGISLDDVARVTRIPLRHLDHIERGDWEALPAVTYSIGFVKAYANAVGLDGPALGAELREQLGATRNVGAVSTAYYEPADPARVPPRSLAILAALIALLLVGAYLLWRRHAVGDAGDVAAPSAEAPIPAKAAPAAAPVAPAPAAGGTVVLDATEPVWVRIYEAGGAKLFEGTLKPGDRYQVPATAVAPEILTGRPNVLRITVGASAIPPLGPPERRIRDVSLKPADLLARIGAPAPAAAPPVVRPRAPRRPRVPAPDLAQPVALPPPSPPPTAQ
jgi:transcriptional regulator with XRE-family HTH domain